MSEVQHTWRLYAPDGDFEVAVTLGYIAAQTEVEHIDHRFEDGLSVFSGRGTPPQHPRIEERLCFVCTVDQGFGCYACCFTGTTYHWTIDKEIIQDSINGLYMIIQDLT